MGICCSQKRGTHDDVGAPRDSSHNRETSDKATPQDSSQNRESYDEVDATQDRSQNSETNENKAAPQDWILRGPKYDIPLPNVSLGKYVFTALLEHGDEIAQVYPGEPEVRLSYRELARQAACVAEQLRMRGVGPGDVVALGCRVVPQFAPLLLGTLLRNAIPAPFNPDLDQEELTVVVRETLRAKLVVSQEPALSALAEGGAPAPLPLSAVDAWLLGRRREEVDPREALRSLSPPDAAGWLDSCAAILCSSGTTGPPKGVMLSHRGLHTLVIVFREMFTGLGNSSDPRPEALISTSPVFWGSGFLMNLFPLSAGMVTCMLPSFDEDTVARLSGEYNISSLFTHPNMAVTFAKNPNSPIRKMLPQIKYYLVGGAAMDAESQMFAEKELGVRITQRYGMTEAVIVTGEQPDTVTPPGSSGKLLFNVEAKVVDLETQQPVGPNQEGEMWVKSPAAALGYWNNPEATADAWDADGWFHTGDVVYYDNDGFFYAVDRIKQLIKFRGLHVQSTQLENLLMSHPSVQLAAVVGKPHPTDQEHPTAFVVLRPGASATPEELQRLVDEKVADHKRLRGGVRLVGSLPHTASGKVAKRVLRRWAAEGGEAGGQ